MGSLVLDTSVVIAWINSEDPHHASVSKRLRKHQASGDEFAISAVAYAELMSNPSRNDREHLRTFVDALGGESVIAVDRAIAERAADLRVRRRSLRTPDALIAATAELRGTGKLLTTDRALARLDAAEYVGASRR